ncbi:MAG: ATP-dependent DNA ligase [Myxococcales bacterium]|nr:ATP-dependent DNA ligase [Myxococcales bacterium]
MKYQYGITPLEYDKMSRLQGNVCAICREPNSRNRFLGVDHCHATKKVRGLLCDTCNTTLGKFHDDPERFLRAAEYLERNVGGPAMRPMLAGKIASVDEVCFPVYCTPKLDGIRCLILGGEAVSRKLKAIPNRHVADALFLGVEGCDGELMVPGATNFGETSSAIMSRDGTPVFEYHVFDLFTAPGGYLERMEVLKAIPLLRESLRLVLPVEIKDATELDAYEKRCLGEGHEGVMLRSPDGPYKHGRSTVREGYLLKLKRFEDDEAVVIGYEELQRNENAAEKDALGHTKRSKAKAGMVGGGTLGKLIVRRADGVEFAIGSGLDDATRTRAWAERDSLAGRLVKYKHLPHGAQEAPRHPIFLGFRHADDV